MKYNLRVEDLVIALNELFREKFPNSKGNYVIKKNIEKGMFAAIKTFSIELFYVDSTIKATTSIMKYFIDERSLNEDDEDKAWNRLGIIFTTQLFKYVLDYQWEEDYNGRN